MSRLGLLAAATVAFALAMPTRLAQAGVEHAPSKEDPAKYAEELQGYVPGASALEGRILAPCCWTQTIDIHGSELSNDLRREIRRRLRAGEGADVIEASFVSRYGQKILAVPAGSPLKTLATLLALAMGGAGAAAFVMLKRWRERGLVPAGGAPSPEPDAKQAQLDARLDAELRNLD